MSGKKAKAARRAARVATPAVRPRSSFWKSWKGGAAGVAVAAIVAASFVLPSLFEKQSAAAGIGLEAGSPVPSFSERNVESDTPITSASVYSKKTLLFFSEGVMCQACFEQIKGLEQMGDVLRDRGIQLVSITPDPRSALEQAIAQYGITTPVISDDDRDMSRAFNTLGRGMHADTPGHAFALIERGKVLWYRDYWLPPDRTMYVEPKKVLDAIPTVT